MAYSTTHLKPSQLPSSVLELADPKWKGKIGIAPAETDFQPIVASVAKRYGTTRALHWIEGLKANAGSHIYPSNEELLAAIDRGGVDLGDEALGSSELRRDDGLRMARAVSLDVLDGRRKVIDHTN